jgi:hypothetical protein
MMRNLVLLFFAVAALPGCRLLGARSACDSDENCPNDEYGW